MRAVVGEPVSVLPAHALELQMQAPPVHEPDCEVDRGEHCQREQQGRIRRAGQVGEEIGVKGFSRDVDPRHVLEQP